MKSLLILGLLSLGQLAVPDLGSHTAEHVVEHTTEIVAEAPARLEEFNPSVLEALEARYMAAKRLPSELKSRVNRNFDGKGVILIGKIQKPDDAVISALVTIEKDGSFATAVAPNRELIFYAHGYYPIAVEPTNQLEGPLYDVGELVFQPLEKDMQPSLTTIVVTRDTRFEQEIEARLIIEHRDFLGSGGGTWQAWARPVVDTKTLSHGERVTFTGLGLNPYRLELWSDGYVVESMDVRPEASEQLDLGAMIVTPAKTFRIRYRGNFDLEQGDLWPELTTTEIVANGRTQFVFHRERHPKGYMKSSRMRLLPNPKQVEILYPVIPSEYYDLGNLDIEQMTREDLSIEMLEPKKLSRPVFLQSGHVYFMQNKRRKVNALFEVVLIEE
jgi:hypothetical protein